MQRTRRTVGPTVDGISRGWRRMADQRSHTWNAHITVAKAMCLIALIAAILNWPPLVLAALPILLYLGYGVLRTASATGASVLLMLSLALGAAVGALWIRSNYLSDGLSYRFHGGWVSVRSSRGHVVAALNSTPGLALPAGSNRLEYGCGDASVPYLGDRPLIFPGILMGPEDDDRFRGGSWGGFVWFETRNQRLGVYRASGVAPFWYLMVLTAAAPLGWATTRWRSGGRWYARERGIGTSCTQTGDVGRFDAKRARCFLRT
jgi:hypothetical protein